MRKYLLFTAIICSFTLLAGPDASAQVSGADELVYNVDRDRLAQTGMKFLNISLSPRAAAMANAVTAEGQGNAMSIFYNPASLSRGVIAADHTVEAALGQVQWIGDIKYNYASAAYAPAGGTYGVFGFSLLSANYGEFTENITFDNDQGYLELGTYSPNATAVGVSYSRVVTDLFSVGGNVKYARQTLGSAVTSYENDTANRREYSESTMVYDFGVLYRTGFRSLNFAMSVRNFSSEVTYVENNFELPLTFRIGASMDMMDLTSVDKSQHSLLLSMDAERPRDYSEQVRVGAEYTFLNTLSLRAGYVRPSDERGLSFGAGVNAGLSGFDFEANYAYTEFGRFGTVNRLGVILGL
jgi:hypothetical protein